MTAYGYKMAPFTITYQVTVLAENFERDPDETEEQARETIRRELQAGFRQTAYDVKWDITDWTIEPFDAEAHRYCPDEDGNCIKGTDDKCPGVLRNYMEKFAHA